MADAKSPAEPATTASTSRIAGLGLLGRKVGMTRIFNDDGASVPVTVLEVSNNRVTQIKTVDTDGYAAVQLAHGARKPSRIAKPQAGHFAKAGVEGGSVLREFRLKESTEAGSALGGELKVGACPVEAQLPAGESTGEVLPSKTCNRYATLAQVPSPPSLPHTPPSLSASV